MTDDTALWTALHRHLPRRTWVPITAIYQIVQHNVPLDAEDLVCQGAHLTNPRWQRNVRRILRCKHRDGTLQRRVAT